MAAVCSQGHDVAEGQNFCPECGEAVGDATSINVETQSSNYGALFADALFFFLAFVVVACLVMFVAALIGAGKANAQDKLDTYAYISGFGAVPWLIAAVASIGVASWRASQLLER
jgi:hypothetical protein